MSIWLDNTLSKVRTDQDTLAETLGDCLQKLDRMFCLSRYPPCLRELRLPFGAHALVPPLHPASTLSLHGWDWHSAPFLVFAKHHGAVAMRSDGMGLFDCFCIFCTPSVMMELVCNYGRPTLVAPNMLDRLLTRLV